MSDNANQDHRATSHPTPFPIPSTLKSRMETVIMIGFCLRSPKGTHVSKNWLTIGCCVIPNAWLEGIVCCNQWFWVIKNNCKNIT